MQLEFLTILYILTYPNHVMLIERDYTKNDSVAYIPYKLKYNQSANIFGPAIVASPYRISLCSPHSCSNISKGCSIIYR